MTTQVLIFDAVGTLIRPVQSVSQTYFDFGNRHGSQKSQAAIKQTFSALFQTIFRSGQPTNQQQEQENWQQLVASLFDDIADTHDLFHGLWNFFADAKNWQLFDDVPSVWNQFLKDQRKLAIASNFDSRLRQILEQLPPLDQTKTLFISSEIQYPKPRAEFFQVIESHFGAANEFVMIGDDPVCDIQPAKARNWKAIHIDRKSPHPSSIHSFFQLSDVLEVEQ